MTAKNAIVKKVAAHASITLSDVSFRYPGQDSFALKDVSVTLHRGEVVAVVGENGCGKSTMAKLVCGLLRPTSGSVEWDNVDVRAIDDNALFDQVSIIMQDPVRWPMTARDNVRIGRLGRADPRRTGLYCAAARAGVGELVDSLPRGWDTLLSSHFQNGRDISGGQWQRLSVARGVYRCAPLLIADEPTAALDARAELAVFEALMDPTDAQRRITVLISHRLVNLRAAHRILVFDGGRLVECGYHETLMSIRGKYFDLYSAQSRVFTRSPSV